jgi:hypothetical protein
MERQMTSVLQTFIVVSSRETWSRRNTDSRETPSPLSGTPNVEMILRHFYQSCYYSSPLWFIVGGAKSLELAAMEGARWTREFMWVRAAGV